MEVEGKRLDDDILSELCEPCQEGNVSTQADGYCNGCEEHMCQTCFQSHVKIKLLRNHVLGASDTGRKQGARSQAEKCKKHNTENIKYYCRSHDSVACGDCLLIDHRKCEPEFIRDLAKNFEESSDFKNILKELGNLADFKAEIELSLARNRKETAEFHDKAMHEIKNCRAEINTWLENVTKIEAEESEIWKENEIILSKLEDWIKIISDMIDEVKYEICTEKNRDENLFIRVIECKSIISEFATKRVPEIKSNLEIKPFAFEPNQKLVLFRKWENLLVGIIRIGNEETEFQISNEKRQNDMKCIDEASTVASSNFPEREAEVVGAGERSPKDPLMAELEKELEKIRQITSVDKKEKEILQQSYNTLKKELEEKERLLFREQKEKEKCVLEMNELEKKIVVLKKEVSSLNDLTEGLKSQLDTRKTEYDLLESLQSELKNNSENHEQEFKRLSSQIRDLQWQKMYRLPDPRAAGFFVDRRVENCNTGWTGTVTDVDSSGYVYVQWDKDGTSNRCRAGVGGNYTVELL